MKIFSALIFFSDVPDGCIYKIDAISYQGKMWLVPEWLDNPLGGWRKPARLICLDVLPHQESPGGPSDFVVNVGIPKYLCNDQNPPKPEDGFVVIDRPDIVFPAIGG